MTEILDQWLPSNPTDTSLAMSLAEAELFLKENGFAVCQSKAMKCIYGRAVKYARASQPVLILGPTGCGKEIVAQMIHAIGAQANTPFLDLNCGSLSENLIESQLFGHSKGAFTGALDNRTGFFEDVGKGCIFLDEIGELPLALQPRLLRVLENRTFRPLGSTGKRQFDGRVIAATNRDISHMVENELFRKDLIHRLNTFTLEIPALSKHMEDIPILAQHFLSSSGRDIEFDHDAFSLLFQYDWPGNIRELKNTINRLVATCEGPVISPSMLEAAIYGQCRFSSLDDAMEDISERLLQLDLGDRFSAIEHYLVDYAMRKAEGNKASAARLLGVHRKTVERRVKALEELAASAEAELENARRAMGENDYEAAIPFYQAALTVLRELPMKADYANMRYEALSKVSICQRNIEGWISEDVMSTYDEAMKLGKSLGREQELISVTFGLWTARLMDLELTSARDIAGEILAQGEKMNSSQYRIQAYLAIANTDFWLGNFSGVFTSANSLHAIYQFREEMLMEQGMDPFALCVMLEGLSAFQVGHFKKARKSITRGLEHSRSIGHPFSLAISLQAACWLEWLFRDKDATRDYAEKLVALSSENGFSFYCGLGEIFLGRVLVEEGQTTKGIEFIQRGYLDKMVHSGGKLFHSFYSLLLAESQIEAGELDAAQSTLETAMNIAQDKSEMCYLAELICLKGTVHALQGQVELAVSEFDRSAYTALPLQSNVAYVNAMFQREKLAGEAGVSQRFIPRLRQEISRIDSPKDHPALREIERWIGEQEDDDIIDGTLVSDKC